MIFLCMLGCCWAGYLCLTNTQILLYFEMSSKLNGWCKVQNTSTAIPIGFRDEAAI